MNNEIKGTTSISIIHQLFDLTTPPPLPGAPYQGCAILKRLRSLAVRGESQRVVAAVEDDELRLEHDVAVDLERLARVRLDASEAS